MAPKQSENVHRISLGEKLDLIPATISLVGTALYALATGLFRGKSGARTFRHHVMMMVARKMPARLSSLQIQYTSSTYDQIYLKFCKAKGLKPDFVSTASGVTGFWIGRRDAKHVVVNFHGGGFAMDATEEYLKFWPGIQDELYVLEDVGRKPEHITLVGDSAGGTLCLAILSHLSHPSGHARALNVEGPLKGVILMAPWVSFDTSMQSMSDNYYRDIDTPDVLRKWSSDYLNGMASDNYAEPLLAPSEWWAGAQVERMLVVAGGDDALIDSMTAWVEKYKVSGNNVDYVVAQHECHIAPLIWPEFGDLRETQQAQAIKSWLKQTLGD